MKDNKKLMLIILIIVGLVLVVGIVFALMNKNKSASQQSYADAEKNSTLRQPNEEVRVSTIGNFYTDKSTRKCTYKSETNGFAFDNTFYFDKNRVLGVIISNQDSKTSTFNQLYLDGVSYSWEEGTTAGTKVEQTAEELKELAEKSLAQADPSVKQDIQDEVERIVITCEPWTADESKFEIPENISFKEITL